MIPPLRTGRRLRHIDHRLRAAFANDRFHLHVMINFLLDLISNLIILAALLSVCCVVNRIRPGTHANAYLLFVVFIAIALAFDTVLTWLVFADSQARYGRFSTNEAFLVRAAAYLTACGVALGLSRMRSRKAAERAQARAIIGTSPYTRSQLPM
ncbi:hypothetical protein [Paraburkholderia bengalensis]